MRVPRIVPILCAALAAAAITVNSQTPAVPIPEQTEADAYTRYELLLPLSAAKFRIIYEVTATTPGAKYYFNPIRTGSIATDERVTYRATGKALPFDIVGAKVAAMGGVRSRDSTQQYIRVTLAHAVPANDGEARVLIEKTYEDAKSYHAEGDLIVFDRPLGIKRNVVILPKGYELVGSASPAMVSVDADGRVRVSFLNDRDDQLPVKITGRKLP